MPFVLPGERVKAEVRDRRGWLVELVVPSAERVAPFCVHFTRCGGCAVQHWQESAYRGWKRGLVETALRHGGLAVLVGAPIDCHGAGRRRVTLSPRSFAVACDPASFARDAAILVAGGYRLEAGCRPTSSSGRPTSNWWRDSAARKVDRKRLRPVGEAML